jgi:hypothetical protein
MGVGSNDLTSTLSPIIHNDTDSALTVRRSDIDDIIGSIGIAANGDTELSSSIWPRVISDMQGTIQIKPNNRMFGIVEVQPPPTTKVSLSPVKDAFVRENIPALNYGLEEDMFAGLAYSGERFRSLLEFNIASANIPQKNLIKSATLTLYHATYNSMSTILGAYGLAADWSELGVTWDNQPSATDLITTFDSGLGKSHVTVDVTQVVRDWFSGAKVNNGFLLKAMNEGQPPYARYFTKDAPDSWPQLTIEHYDPTVVSAGRADLKGSISLMGRSDISGSLTINSHYANNELIASIQVTDPHYRDGTITVNRPDLNGSITVTYSGTNEITSSVSVRNKLYSEILSGISVTRQDMDGSIYVRPRVDIDATVTVRVPYTDDIDSTISVNRPDASGSAYVRPYTDLPSIITPRVVGTYDLDSQIAVNTPDMSASIYVRPSADLDSTVTIRLTSANEVQGDMTVSRPDLDSDAYVKYNSDIYADIKIRGYGSSDMNSSISINRADTPSTATVKIPYDINSAVTVRVSAVSDQQGSLTVRSNASSDLPATITPRIKQISDLPTTISVYLTSDLQGTITVKHTGYSDLTSSLTPRWSAYSEIDSTITIRSRSDLQGTITVRKVTTSDLNGSIAVSRNDVTCSITVDADFGYVFIM